MPHAHPLPNDARAGATTYRASSFGMSNVFWVPLVGYVTLTCATTVGTRAGRVRGSAAVASALVPSPTPRSSARSQGPSLRLLQPRTRHAHSASVGAGQCRPGVLVQPFVPSHAAVAGSPGRDPPQ